MIRNENEYARAVEEYAKAKDRLAAAEAKYALEFQPEQVQVLMEPLLSFHEQLAEEIRVYDRLKRGDLGDLTNLRGLGRLLVHMRISRGISQRELAERLEVHESQVSRDERNEYHGITLDRATRVLEALGARLLSSVIEPAATQPAKSWEPPPMKVSRETHKPCEPDCEAVAPRVRVNSADIASAA